MNVVVITGASSGIGREFTMQLDRGLKSVDEFWLAARRTEPMKELSSMMRHSVKILPLDLMNESDIKLFFEVLAEEKPVLRMLVNCAGYGLIGDFMEVPLDEQTGQVDVNCRALMQMTYACIPYMRRKSRIIQMSSSAAFLPQPGFAVYAATKSFVFSFSMALREELRKKEIYVTAVCPGPVKTAFFEVAERYGSTLAVKRLTMVSPEKAVRQALADSAGNRAVSVCGPLMKAFRIMTGLMPQGLLIRIAHRLK